MTRYPDSRSRDPELSALGTVLLGQVGQISAKIAALIREQVSFYQKSDLVSERDLQDTISAHLVFIFSPLGNPGGEFDTTAARETGRRRAAAGVPLPAVMDSYRIGTRYVWQVIVDEARRTGLVPSDSLVRAASDIWLAQDEFTQAMADGYREEMATRILAREQERSALVGALIEGRITETTAMWEAADILRLSRLGPYVVVAAQLPAIGRLALPGIENHLRVADVSSAWRLLTDLEVGVVEVRKPKHLDLLTGALARHAGTRAGISPPYDDLQDTAYALRFARIAMTGSRLDDGSSVTIFDRSPLAVTAVGAPDIMQRVSRNVLGGLDSLPAEERGMLLDTLEAWLTNGGSASKTAQRMFCHPNTVRHRLRRIAERTGRSLSDPLDTSELCIALQAERRLPAPEAGAWPRLAEQELRDVGAEFLRARHERQVTIVVNQLPRPGDESRHQMGVGDRDDRVVPAGHHEGALADKRQEGQARPAGPG